MSFTRPRILVSRCLGFDACRYDGACLPHDFIDRLRPQVDFITVCPEVDLGLPVPRDPIRIVKQGNSLRLFQPSSGRDFTEPMNLFTRNFFSGSPSLDGAVFKSRSPSCAIRDAKYFRARDDVHPVRRGPGLFARAILNRSPRLPVMDEEKLLTPRAQDRFLTAVFLQADFRSTVSNRSRRSLFQFHTRHRLFFRARNQSILKRMDRLVDGYSGKSRERVRYRTLLSDLLVRGPRIDNQVKILQEYLSGISASLPVKDCDRFHAEISEFRVGERSLDTLRKSPAFQGREREQSASPWRSFFEPYPRDLRPVEIR